MDNEIEVKNLSEPDDIIRFDTDGQARTFGRDDDVCDIVIWSALNDPQLSRVAGRLWRMEGQLWLRNLSRHHELVVMGAAGITGSPLPPRASDDDPGAAQALPPGVCVILGPAGCELVVSQRPVTAAATPEPDGHPAALSVAPVTTGVPEIPEHLLTVALALCEPLLTGHLVPATYRQICQRLGIDSYKRVRLMVSELCLLYQGDACATYLNGRVPAQTELVPELRRELLHGVWRFRREDPAPEPGRVPEQLPMPEYFRVAQMLVRRGLVRVEHLGLLGEPLAAVQ